MALSHKGLLTIPKTARPFLMNGLYLPSNREGNARRWLPLHILCWNPALSEGRLKGRRGTQLLEALVAAFPSVTTQDPTRRNRKSLFLVLQGQYTPKVEIPKHGVLHVLDCF